MPVSDFIRYCAVRFAANMSVEAAKQLPSCWKPESCCWKLESVEIAAICKRYNASAGQVIVVVWFQGELPILIEGRYLFLYSSCFFYSEASFIFFISLIRKTGLKSDAGASM